MLSRTNLFSASCKLQHRSQEYLFLWQSISLAENCLKQAVTLVFCSISIERSKNASSLDVMVSHVRHRVSLVNMPEKRSWIQDGLPCVILRVTREEEEESVEPDYDGKKERKRSVCSSSRLASDGRELTPMKSLFLFPLCSLLAQLVHQIVEKLMRILMHRTSKQFVLVLERSDKSLRSYHSRLFRLR